MPESRDPETPARLFVMLHGAGQSRNFLDEIFPEAEPHGLLVLLPRSRGRTWDLFLGGYGPDVVALDRALEWVFARCPVDAAGVTFGGFSDGGSYSLSLGLGNGDLFPRIAAFSPGYLGPPQRIGMPSIFIAHGTEDEVLPIARTSRPIVQQLRAWQYEVAYREFEGPHVIRLSDVRNVLAWSAGGELTDSGAS